jgi:hypothetical protein
MSRPEGMLRPVHWPEMALMDSRTSDGRLLVSAGGGVRELPRPFYAQFDNEGHYGAKLVGSIDAVTLGDDGTIEGWGWILDDENGKDLVRYNKAGALRTNSVDLAETKYDIDWASDDPNDPGFWEMLIDFVQWKIGATTAVGMPAFPNARFELPDDELTAALLPSDEPIVMSSKTGWSIHVDLADTKIVTEVKADAGATVPYDDFNIPESDQPHKILVDREGRVFGHLAQWDKAHRGLTGLVTPPRPAHNYTEFNHPGPLTEQGQVGTGPIFLVGGHPKSVRGLTQEQIAEAYGGIENAWADVRVTAGKFGPWVSGRVRPGLSDEALYAARASHISGHWLGNDLVAIVSVNVPGYMPGAGFSHQHTDGQLELVAGFVPFRDKPTEETVEVVTTNTTALASIHIDEEMLRNAVSVRMEQPPQFTTAEHDHRVATEIITLSSGVDEDGVEVIETTIEVDEELELEIALLLDDE